MSDNETDPTDRTAWIEALLQAAYPTDRSGMDRRIDEVIAQLEATPVSGSGTRSEQTVRGRKWTRSLSYAAAAAILLAAIVAFQFFSPPDSALAAIEQSLMAAAQNVARHYQITVTLRNAADESLEVKSDLYVQGNDRFALRHPALLPGATAWLGRDGGQAWVVPAVGPVRTGDDLALSRWLHSHEELSTPYLHVTTVLDRMARGYRLDELEPEAIVRSDGSSIVCRHVIGRLKSGDNRKLPHSIELWAARESGIAQRLVATWNLASHESGRANVIIEFLDQAEVPDNWFQADAHFTSPRRVLHLDAAN